MKKDNIDCGWQLKIMNPLTLKMSTPIEVDLPHDYSITQKMDPFTFATASNAYLPGGVLEYEKTIFVPEQWKGKAIVLEFEGVYMNSVIRVNKNIVVRNPSGYSSFHCDISDYLRYGENNSILVSVNNSAQANCRWYSGTGIYRHVWLLTGEETYIEPWGVFVLPELSPELDKATVNIKTKLCNLVKNMQNLTIEHTVYDTDGNEIAAASASQQISACGTAEIEQTATIDNPKLWSPDSPYLYTVASRVILGDKIIDYVETKTGIRQISFDTKNGFVLNGTTLKLKGGCVHHDCGILGAAAHDDAEWRKVRILKESGFNAVRCAHNPPSPAFLDACDSLGMLAIDEAFDCWNEAKMVNDYSIFFKEWWQKDMSAMILRDRNHPSVIMWSTGNEIPERSGCSDGYKCAKELADYVRSIDPSRAVVNALCHLWEGGDEKWAELTKDFAAPLDVVGYNYLLGRYEKDGELFPERIICGTETFPKDAFDYWEATEKYDHVIGDFVWTALDYLGEAGIGRILTEGETGFVGAYPWSHANCGDIDLCGFKRPQSHYRDCVWGMAEKPYIAVHKPCDFGKELKMTQWGWPDVAPTWTFTQDDCGKPVKVDVYCKDEEVELFLNNNSLGRKPAGKANKYLASFDVNYEQGELLAVSYNNGIEVSREKLITAGRAVTVKLTVEKPETEHGNLRYVAAEAKDENGNPADNAENTVFFSVSGSGKLIAVGNSNPKTDELYVGNIRKLYRGKAISVVMLDETDGECIITASADGLQVSSVTISKKGN